MKILLVTGALGYRGTAKALVAYAIILGKKHDVRIWGYDNREETENEVYLKERGFVVYIGQNLLKEALDFKPDIVNLHRPGIFRQRDLDVFVPFHNQGARCIETNVFGRVDKSIVGVVDLSIQVSRWDLWQWNRWKGKNYPIRGVYCPNPVDCEGHKRVDKDVILMMRHLWGVPSESIVLGRIGNTNWEALEKPLLECLHNIPNLYFVHVDDHIDYLPSSIEKHPRVRRVPRLRGMNELSSFYSSCDVMVSMSIIGESFGYVNAEAMACGTPVIALSTILHCNAQSEVVAPNDGGYTIAQSKKLLSALKMFIKEREQKHFETTCRKLIEDRYSFQACERILYSIFGEGTIADKEIVSDVPDSLILQNIGKAIGSYPIRDKICFKFLYTPLAAIIISYIRTKLARVFKILKRFM